MDSKTLNLTVMGLSTAAVTVVIIFSNNSHSSCKKDPKCPLLAITYKATKVIPMKLSTKKNYFAHLWASQVQVNSVAIGQDFKCEFNRL